MNALRAFPDRAALMHAAADRLEEYLRRGLQQRGAACAALSGGTTPELAYALLAQRALDWSKVIFALVDERFVPPSDPASNEGLLRRSLAPALVQGARVLPMWRDNATPLEAADAADRTYAPLHIDVALMGMGDDGHTASWFPGMTGLPAALDLDTPRHVIAVEAPGAAGASARLTLTRASVARADQVLLLITGEAKRARFESRQADGAQPLPALLAATAGKVEIFWAP